MLRKLIRAGAVVALCTGPAAAQDVPLYQTPGIPLNQRPPPTREDVEKQKANDRAYDAAMKKIPDKKSSGDPWGDIRPTTPPTAKNKQQ
jgi:hypothetical protein